MTLKIECVEKLGVFIQKKKRIKIIIGGRASTKSTFAADYVLSQVSMGKKWCCAREFLNSIEESVHALLVEEIERCGFTGFDPDGSIITHASGGRIFHKGLARNIASIKSVVTDGLWIEEGETLSKKTISVLTASIRVSAGKAKKARESGEEIAVPEIWITMNRGSRKDPVSEAFLRHAEVDLAKSGYYEDDNMMIMEVNYTDIPKQWFIDSGLEPERASDERNMTPAEYNHKWHGAYNDSIDNAIIQQEWFDACIDAHEKLGFKPMGQEKVAYDPSDVGDDPEALAHMHGVVVLEAMSADARDIEEATDWACSYANSVKPDAFIWDCDGMGIGLKRQVSMAFNGKKIESHQFKGSESAWMPDEIYEPTEDEKKAEAKTNIETFANQRAQFYWMLRDRMFKTWLAVERGKYINPDELISFSSSITHMDLLRAEVCRIPRKFIASGRIQLMTKQEMLAKKIPSPNISDCLMMLMKPLIPPARKKKKINYRERTVKDYRIGY